MAGKMIAAAPAIQLSRLFAGSLYKAMTMEIEWDTTYPSSEAMKADMDCFRDTVALSKGGNWWKRDQVLLVAGDASEYAYAAYTPDGEFKHPMVVTFTEVELQLMAQKQYSSTIREIICILKTVKVLLEQAPEQVQHKRLRYETDSQTGSHSVMGMKGNRSTFPVVKVSKEVSVELLYAGTRETDFSNPYRS